MSASDDIRAADRADERAADRAADRAAERAADRAAGAVHDAAGTIHDAAGAVRAPPRLQEAVAAQHVTGARRRRVGGALAACVATALAALLAFAHTGADVTPPSIADAAAIAVRAPALPSPARDARAPALLRASGGGVRFPDYAYGRLGWRADGQRRGRAGGRSVAVVSYARVAGARTRAGYAIVGGPPLRRPDAASTVTRGGVRYDVLRRDRATIVTWRQSGRTCVLASRGASAAALLRLAAWRGGGAAGGGPRY